MQDSVTRGGIRTSNQVVIRVSSHKRSVINYSLIVLSLEKIVQHVIVSMSLLYDTGGIRSTVAVDYRALMMSGAVLAVLFVIALWALVQKKRWGLYLTVILAASDIIGEFIAQGTVLVAINVSIIVAITLLLLCYLELQNLRKNENGKAKSKDCPVRKALDLLTARKFLRTKRL